MGSRWGRQAVAVYIPEAPADVRATVRYRIYANGEQLGNGVVIDQSQNKRWWRLGYYNFNGAHVEIRVYDNDTATEHFRVVGLDSSRIGVDAVAMRCISRCHDHTKQIYPHGYPYEDGRCGPADKWAMFQGQCTSYVTWRLIEAGVSFHNYAKFNNNPLPVRPGSSSGRWSHARYWADTARRIGITTDNNPAPGSVAQWGYPEDSDDNSKPGHVAYVHAVKEDGTIVLHDMNYSPRPNDCKIRERTLRPGDTKWPDAFIHFERCAGNSCS